MKYGVIVFPGSNCDHDCFWVTGNVIKQDVKFIWHKEKNVNDVDCIILPGGFSYGDYLRTGAIARFSPVMESVIKHAEKGKLVLGICNGFQILTECGLLPGTLMRNRDLRFICKDVYLSVENNSTRFTNCAQEGQILSIPIAHGEGNYYANAQELTKLKENNQIIFRYCDREGKINSYSNPNGSLENIAGIVNKNGNVLGMMPHPERCCENMMSSMDGIVIFDSIINSLN
ncbi:MAG: phosphoribosylformylglycinamidine synthase subunit PurQ [Candidatus Theseobacter exili]|nr:phosphoribosylformylglycinamidine synthase subunit PurQ [Candidatus Theseobacter exili]